MNYSRFMQRLRAAGVSLDRRSLAELAARDRPAFDAVVEAVAKDVKA